LRHHRSSKILLKDYIFIDNAFDDYSIDILYKYGKTVEYYQKQDYKLENINLKEFPENIPEHINGNWQGYRSDNLVDINWQLFENTAQQLAEILFPGINKYILLSGYFHVLPYGVLSNNSWWHIDEDILYAGVLYLNPDPLYTSGTTIKINTSKTISINYEYNRLVLYKANLPHKAESGWGTDISDCRLTLNIFIKQINLDK